MYQDRPPARRTSPTPPPQTGSSHAAATVVSCQGWFQTTSTLGPWALAPARTSRLRAWFDTGNRGIGGFVRKRGRSMRIPSATGFTGRRQRRGGRRGAADDPPARRIVMPGPFMEDGTLDGPIDARGGGSAQTVICPGGHRRTGGGHAPRTRPSAENSHTCVDPRAGVGVGGGHATRWCASPRRKTARRRRSAI
jgi:hypothetical protein